jgi:SAM-dependent methyltransferase
MVGSMTDVDAPGAGPNHAQATYWEDRSGSWIASEAWWLSTVAGPFGDAATEQLNPRPGQRLLDIGCGTGPTTVRLAKMIGPDGTITGVDISPSMVDAARRRAADAEVDNATFAVADAQVADLGVEVLDGVFSQFGIMFFADPTAAFANVRAAVRPGGRLAFACWQDLSRNDWMTVPGVAAASVTGQIPTMPEPGAPGPFSLADPDRIRKVLTDAGWADVRIADVTTDVVVPEDRVEDMLVGVSRMGAVREQLEAFKDPAMRDRISDAVRTELLSRLVDGEVRLASAAWAVTAVA